MIIIFFLTFVILLVIIIFFVKKQTNKIIIGGCAWNCGKHIDDVFKNILKITKLYANFLVIIAYDESSDDTLEKLIKYRNKYKDKIIILMGKKKSTIRTENLAIARNKILRVIKKQYQIQPFLHFIMMDLDDVCSLDININTLQFYLQSSNDWDALSFNRKNYYDIWALSYDPFLVSLFHWKKTERMFIKNDIEKKLKDCKSLFPCMSAFNGFSIYRSSIFINSFYDWKIESNLKFLTKEMIHKNKVAFPSTNEILLADQMDCEHRFFHFFAYFHLGARIMISPKCIF